MSVAFENEQQLAKYFIMNGFVTSRDDAVVVDLSSLSRRYSDRLRFVIALERSFDVYFNAVDDIASQDDLSTPWATIIAEDKHKGLLLPRRYDADALQGKKLSVVANTFFGDAGAFSLTDTLSCVYQLSEAGASIDSYLALYSFMSASRIGDFRKLVGPLVSNFEVLLHHETVLGVAKSMGRITPEQYERELKRYSNE